MVQFSHSADQTRVRIPALSRVDLTHDRLPGIQLTTPLATADQDQMLFRGQVRDLLPFRDCLLFLNRVVESRFYRPDLWRYLDPVVTPELEQLRLECFSSCCSVYGRVDFAAHGFDGYALLQRGTTHVNFNPAFIQGLLHIPLHQRAVFEVGTRFVQILTDQSTLKEEKVKLPLRWIKAFLQSQALWRRASSWQTLNALQARQLLTRLSGQRETIQYLTPTAQGLQLLQRPSYRSSGLPVAGLHRLTLLKPLIPHIQQLSIYTLPESQGTIWVADCAQARVTLALSASVKNGFSGEGESLRSASAYSELVTDQALHHSLAELGSFTLNQLCETLSINPAAAFPLIDTLATEGVIGYDVAAQAWFYRVLPFSGLQPTRLKHAHTLVKQNTVTLQHVERTLQEMKASAWVEGKHAVYHCHLSVVSGQIDTGQCTCQWFREHQLQRGPCKHLLALRFAAENP